MDACPVNLNAHASSGRRGAFRIFRQFLVRPAQSAGEPALRPAGIGFDKAKLRQAFWALATALGYAKGLARLPLRSNRVGEAALPSGQPQDEAPSSFVRSAQTGRKCWSCCCRTAHRKSARPSQVPTLRLRVSAADPDCRFEHLQKPERSTGRTATRRLTGRRVQGSVLHRAPKRVRSVLMGREITANPQVVSPQCFTQPILHIGAEMAIHDPWGIADQDVGQLLGPRQPGRTHQVTKDKCPYSVAPIRACLSAASAQNSLPAIPEPCAK
jgi:hypothetical protein